MEAVLKAIKRFFSCSTQMSINFILLINAKMPTIVGILTFNSMVNSTSDSFKQFFAAYFLVVEISILVELSTKIAL